jgi:hypothetical protein
MHYLHTSSLLQLQSVYLYAEEIPQAVLAAAAQTKTANFSEQIAAGMATALRHARRRAGWTMAAASAPARHMAGSGTLKHGRWLAFGEVEQLLNAHANQQQPVANIAKHFGVPEGFICASITASAGIADWLEAKVEHTSSDTPPLVQMPVTRMNTAERLQLDHLVRNIESAWQIEPELIVRAVGLILDRTTRLHEELTLREPAQLKTALAFFSRCGIKPLDLHFVLRRRGGIATVPDWAAPLLGAYRSTPVKVLPPDTDASDSSLARWLRIRLVDKKGQAIPKVMARAVFTAWVNMTAAPAGRMLLAASETDLLASPTSPAASCRQEPMGSVDKDAHR